MKHFKLKLTLVAAVLTFALTPASAYDFTVDGLYYDIVSLSDLTCAVTSGDQQYKGDVVVPESVTCDGKTLTVVSIADNAFYQCTGLTSISIPGTVSSIGNYALAFCPGLTSLTIPASVESIGVGAFPGCSNLTSIRVASGNKVYDSRGDCNAIIETATNTLLQGCSTTYIPSTVTSIGGQAFFGCYGLTYITIPNSVTSIGFQAFFDSGLMNLFISNSVTTIYPEAFQGCSSLMSLTIPASVTYIGFKAFYGCPNLTSIRVDSGNEVYDSREDCNAIIETATNTLLQGCSTTYIPNTVTSIGYCAFSECSGLKSITIPNSVTSIDQLAFSGCSGLTSLIIGSSVSTIGMGAFEQCFGLKSIISLNTTPPMLAPNSFTEDQYGNAQLYVPQKAIEAYKAADYWKNFFRIEAVETTGIETTEAYPDGQPTAIFDLQGRKLQEPQRGINIIGGKKVLLK